MIEAQELKRKIEGLRNIPTMPGIVQKIADMVDSPNISATDVGKVIAQDQILSAKVLRLINSSFYGFPGRISSVSHGVVLLGFNVIKGIILSASVFEMLSDDMIGLWEHSLGVSAAAGVVARYRNYAEPEEVTTAGLLHDIGKVILAIELPEVVEDLDAYVAERRESRVVAEKELLGITHCHVASWLCAKWNLPINISEPLIYHHVPQRAKFAVEQTAMVHLANLLVRARGFGNGGDPFVPKMNQDAWNILGLSMDDLEAIIDKLEGELTQVESYDMFSA